MRELAILAYHKVGEPPPGGWRSWFYVPEDEFASHLEYLRDSEWEVVGAKTFLRGLDEPEVLPEKAALLTFDDGYRSMATVAAPILAGFAFPSVLFVPTDFIGGTNAFEDGAEPVEAICGWDHLRSLGFFGVSVHSHGVSHRAFSKMGDSERDEELVRSKAVLEEGLGKPVEIFAYPYGDSGPEGASLAVERAGYRAACLYKGGVERVPGHDPFRLSRLAVGSGTDVRKKLGGV
jgi:peptidoglycan/xylan/chitin deacetylase (PgdA/CDA1 family)